MHQVAIRGPEGEQEVRDEKGKLATGGMRVKFTGYQEYVRELMAEAGLIDLELEKMIAEVRKAERAWSVLTGVIPVVNA